MRQRRRRNLPGVSGPGVAQPLGVDDPAKATGSPADIDAAFVRAYRVLRARIEALLALPAEQLHGERAALKAELDRIGQLSA